MSDAPERIFIKQLGPPVGGYVGEAWEGKVRREEIQYVRADLYDALRARVEELENEYDSIDALAEGLATMELGELEVYEG